MFNGIVEHVSSVLAFKQNPGSIELQLALPAHFTDLQIGDSMAINGVCLSITAITESHFSVTIVPETLRVTNLCELKVKSLVNLERALKAHSRVNGHFVQGHVDHVSEILEWQADGDAFIAKISITSALQKYLVNKGFITIDGMSITIIQSKPAWFNVTFIPHTQKSTIVHQYRVGTKLNIEVDMLAKYVHQLLGTYTCNPT